MRVQFQDSLSQSACCKGNPGRPPSIPFLYWLRHLPWGVARISYVQMRIQFPYVNQAKNCEASCLEVFCRPLHFNIHRHLQCTLDSFQSCNLQRHSDSDDDDDKNNDSNRNWSNGQTKDWIWIGKGFGLQKNAFSELTEHTEKKLMLKDIRKDMKPSWG